MRTKWLFPQRFRFIGWLIFVPSVVLGLATLYAGLEWSFLTTQVPMGIGVVDSSGRVNLTNELAGVGIIVGLMFIAFSREKVEDEMIGQMRLEALQWSIYVNYLILIIALFTVYEGAFFSVMIYNMFTVLLVFIGRFRWLIYRDTHRLAV